jgi:two-component system chemotaxis response regulator CheY
MDHSVLVVDDSKPMRSAIKRTLKRAGFDDLNIFEAKDGNEALCLVENTPISLIITDYNMPGMNGLEFIKNLKKRTEFKNIPIVLMTGEINETKFENLKYSDVAVHRKKDIKPEKIRLILSTMLQDQEIVIK